jgi:beta-1,4-mannosyltransferase
MGAMDGPVSGTDRSITLAQSARHTVSKPQKSTLRRSKGTLVVRVLAIPGRRHAQNSYFPLLWDALGGAGSQMISARTTAAFTLRYDILHVHLPELLVERPIQVALILGPLFLAYVAASRIAGKEVVWTIHEVTPTLPHLLTRPFLWCMRRLTTAYVFMNRTSEDEFFKRHPGEHNKIIARVPHSSYPLSKISAVRRSDIRASLNQGTDCLVVGLLGEIKPYKNPVALQYLPMTDPDGRPLRLVVAGSFHSSCNVPETEAMFRTMDPERLVHVEERPSDKTLSELIQSVDIVFLPYLRGWNSGLAMFALGCGARLLCSALPMFREIEEALGPPWVYVFDHNAADLSQELAAAVARVSKHKPSASDHARLDQFLAARSFEQAALRHLDLYRNLLLRDVTILSHG